MQIIHRALRFHFGTTIALFSGGPQHQKLASQVIKNLRISSNDSVSFIGVIGDENASGFNPIYSSSDVLNQHDFDRTRNQTQLVSDSILIPYRTLTHIKNNILVKTLIQKDLFADLISKQVDCLVTVGNFSLSKRIYTALNKYYQKIGKLRPPTFLFDLHIADRNIKNQDYLDYIFYQLAKMPDNRQRYVFPSMCIGYEGLFRAFQYLQKFKNNTENFSFLSENFSYDVHELVAKARQSFRQSRAINQDKYIIVFAPGQSAKEIKFSFKYSIPGINQFLSNATSKNISKDFFQVFLLLPDNQQAAEEIKNSAAQLSEILKVHLIEPKDRYGALCAADFGILHNGDVTVEAAACQLPATIINSMSNVRAYMQYLYNGHCSPLNVSTNYHGYEQLLGSTSVTSEKLSYILTQHFERPKLRFYYPKLYRQHIQFMLSKSGQNPTLDVSQTGLEVASKLIIEFAVKYNQMDHNTLKSINDRKEALSFDHH